MPVMMVEASPMADVKSVTPTANSTANESRRPALDPRGLLFDFYLLLRV
jgi:hypothetical protein